MSVSKVSRRYDINANLIFRWIKAAGYDVEATSALVPIGIIGSPNKLTPTKQNQPAPLSCRSYAVPPVTATTMIEVDLRGGTKIRIDAGVKGVSLQQILKLIRGLA